MFPTRAIVIVTTCILFSSISDSGIVSWAGTKIKNKISAGLSSTISSSTDVPTTSSSIDIKSGTTCECTCGVANDNTRIVGGQPTEPNEYPWMVRLLYFNRFYCGGTLLNDRYVLTAAHCVKGFLWFLIKVSLGDHDRCNKTIKPESRYVIRVFSGNFSYLNFNNDVAILRLSDRVPITDTIRPVCLPKDKNETYAGKMAKVTGWGTLEEGGKPACILRDVDVPVLSNEVCERRYQQDFPDMVTSSMLCAGFEEGGKDSCQGDSGGPLVTRRSDKRYEIIGVVSWGNGCGRPGFPGVYARVTKFLSWVEEKTRDGCFCLK